MSEMTVVLILIERLHCAVVLIVDASRSPSNSARRRCQQQEAGHGLLQVLNNRDTLMLYARPPAAAGSALFFAAVSSHNVCMRHEFIAPAGEYSRGRPLLLERSASSRVGCAGKGTKKEEKDVLFRLAKQA